MREVSDFQVIRTSEIYSTRNFFSSNAKKRIKSAFFNTNRSINFRVGISATKAFTRAGHGWLSVS